MTGNAFTAGVKPGGLTTSTEIRILLCYLVKCVATPLSQSEIETALVGEELVNYFELADNLAELCGKGMLQEHNGRYSLLPAGHEIANNLADDLPRSVKEAAVRAAVLAQQFARKEAQHKAEIVKNETGYTVNCKIEDIGSVIFSFSLYMPDAQSAELVKTRFIESGADIFKLMLASLTGNKQMLRDILTRI